MTARYRTDVDGLASSRGLRSAADVVAAAQLACLLEASIPTPGTVAPGVAFADRNYEELLASAAAIGHALAGAAAHPLGATVRSAVEWTGHWTFANTNLGTMLLLAPLVRAALLSLESTAGATTGLTTQTLRARLRRVLETTTVEDTRNVNEAVQRVAPAGQDDGEPDDEALDPTLTLLEAMHRAADRDGIAREYATVFETTFERGVPTLEWARRDGLSWSDAVGELFLTLLAAGPDTSIVRRAGPGLAQRATEGAAGALAVGGVRTPGGRAMIAELDSVLRDPDHRGHPGTTADLTAAAILVLLLCGGWHAPLT